MKCITKNCENHTHQGMFVGELCNPCYQFITTGEGVYSQVYRNAKPVQIKLTEEELDDIPLRLPNVWLQFARAVEAKLLEKNWRKNT